MSVSDQHFLINSRRRTPMGDITRKWRLRQASLAQNYQSAAFDNRACLTHQSFKEINISLPDYDSALLIPFPSIVLHSVFLTYHKSDQNTREHHQGHVYQDSEFPFSSEFVKWTLADPASMMPVTERSRHNLYHFNLIEINRYSIRASLPKLRERFWKNWHFFKIPMTISCTSTAEFDHFFSFIFCPRYTWRSDSFFEYEKSLPLFVAVLKPAN
jgi:hypothetical protein